MRRATDLFAVLIALAAFAVSYSTQMVLASRHGFPGWEAWLWPGIADAAALAMILRLHFSQVRPGWYTVEAWLVFAVASIIMVGANAIADRSDPLGGWMHAVVPVVAMLVWHVVIHGRPVETSASTDRAPAREPNGAARLPARASVRRLLRRSGSEVRPERVAELAHVSIPHARRLLREERQPHVVEASGTGGDRA